MSIKNICATVIMSFLISGCSSISQQFDEWGQSMPTYNSGSCDGWFCWGDNTNKENSLNSNPQGGRYSPLENSSANGMQPSVPTMMMGNPSPSGHILPPDTPLTGMPPSGKIVPGEPLPSEFGQDFGPVGGGGQVPMMMPPHDNPDYGQLPWGDGQVMIEGSDVPSGLNLNNPPPGAIPGVNWPPKMPPEQLMHDDNDLNIPLPDGLQ